CCDLIELGQFLPVMGLGNLNGGLLGKGGDLHTDFFCGGNYRSRFSANQLHDSLLSCRKYCQSPYLHGTKSEPAERANAQAGSNQANLSWRSEWLLPVYVRFPIAASP